MVELVVDADVYQKFCKLKSSSTYHSSSDSHFLSSLLTHIEFCSNSSSVFNCDTSIESDDTKKICPECQFVATSLEGLRQHVEAEHTDLGSFTCTCSAAYPRLADFILHYTNCSVAATDLLEPKTCRKRRKRSVSTLRGESASNTVTETYDSYHHPSVSPVAGPSADKPFGCPKCLKGFKSKSLLEQHMHLHYPPRYKCRWCGNVYRWPPVYYHHKQKCKNRPLHNTTGHKLPDQHEEQAQSNQTPNSNESFAQAQKALAQFLNFRSTVLPSTGNGNAAQSSSITNGAMPDLSMTCICAEVFPDFQSYFKHAVSCPGILSASSLFESLIPRPLGLLPETSMSSVTNCTGGHHQLNTFKEDSPSLPKEETSSKILGTNGIFSCSICGKDFNSKLSLKQHVDGKHRPEGKYLCRTCGKRYRWGASFYYHRKTCIATDTDTGVVNQSAELLTGNT